MKMKKMRDNMMQLNKENKDKERRLDVFEQKSMREKYKHIPVPTFQPTKSKDVVKYNTYKV